MKSDYLFFGNKTKHSMPQYIKVERGISLKRAKEIADELFGQYYKVNVWSAKSSKKVYALVKDKNVKHGQKR